MPASVAPTPLRKPDSLRERIYAELRAQLQRCAYGPEDRLVDVEIAQRYGTSRMPAREALLQLVNDGYLVGTTRGFAIPRLTPDDIRDIFEIRKLLEPRAAALAARDLREPAARALGRALEAARRAVAEEDAAAMIAANIEFRSAWLGEVRNARLAAEISRFIDHVQTVRIETLKRPDTRRVVIEGLETLHGAFLARDAIAAGDIMSAFIAAAEQAYLTARRAAEAEEAQARAGEPSARLRAAGGRGA